MEYKRNENGKRQNNELDQRHMYQTTKRFEQTSAGVS
jgi:hypothetical protein